MKVKALTSAVAFAVLLSGGVQAAGTVGFVDLSFGISGADVKDRKEVHAGFASLSGAVAIPAGANGSVVLEGEYRRDNHKGSVVDGDDMEYQAQAGAHYLHDFSGKKFGVFLAYADADHDADNEHYRTLFGGIEGIIGVSPTVTLYGQAGIGDRRDDDQSSEGFNDGKFARLGAAYSGFANTLLKLEGEYGATDSYEDSNEEGRFWKLSLGGETGIAAVKGLAVTYGISHGVYDAKNDNNKVEENQIHVGIRYYFGGTTSAAALKAGLIGLPSLPARSMSWVPALD